MEKKYIILVCILFLSLSIKNNVYAAPTDMDVYVNNNLNYGYVGAGAVNITIDNARYPMEWNQEVMNDFPKFGHIRMCQFDTTNNFEDFTILQSGTYGKPIRAKYYETTTPCDWGGATLGKEIVISWEWAHENGYLCYIDLDLGYNICNIVMQYQLTATNNNGILRIRFGFSNKFYVPEDIDVEAEATAPSIDEILDANTNGITGPKLSGKDKIEYEKDRQEYLENMMAAQKEAEIEIFINSNANGFLWDLIERIRNIDIKISTLMITMMSLGVIKLILSR